MGKTIDARGKACPQPVVMTKRALESLEEGILTVIVDNPTSRDNVERFAKSQGCNVDINERQGEYLVDIVMGYPCTGGLFVREGIDLRPLRLGGTGSRSESWEHPNFLPDRYECGTPNTLGIVGLGEGARFVQREGVDRIRLHEMALTHTLLEGLEDIEAVTVYGPGKPDEQTPTVSINVKGQEPSEVGYRLDREFGIMTRVGLHCNPGGHRTIGTFPHGTVRLSMGYFNTQEDVAEVLEALRKIVRDS